MTVAPARVSRKSETALNSCILFRPSGGPIFSQVGKDAVRDFPRLGGNCFKARRKPVLERTNPAMGENQKSQLR